MKKKISGFLAAALLGLSLTGCGGGDSGQMVAEDPNTVPEDTYEINWYMQGMPQDDVAAVEEKVN